MRKEEGEIERMYSRTPAGKYKRKEWKMREEYTRGEQGEREGGEQTPHGGYREWRKTNQRKIE